jgi:alpha-D-ribose 1-methylphosphonate 5-triphosphate diphosphatase
MSGRALFLADAPPRATDAALVLARARVVTDREVLCASLRIADGRIQALDPGDSAWAGALDLEGDLLLPGLVETHTDNLERYLVPRPSVVWPSPLASVLAHDAQLIAAGITTVLDAVAVGAFWGNQRHNLLACSIRAVAQARTRGLLRADHGLHLRLEVSDAAVLEMFEQHVDDPALRMVSLMDHTPGQRQWADLDKFRTFHQAKNWSDEEFRRVVADRVRMQHEFAHRFKPTILARCRRLGVPLASHDDTTVEHVAEALRDGATIAEFPTTLAAARAAKAHGLAVVAGAPNLVRGASHSGNLRVDDLAAENLLDILSSDYAPMSLLQAAFVLHHRHDYPLPRAVETVSATPARLVGFVDRGRIAVGLRADLLRVGLVDQLPVVKAVWREGVRVF